MAARRTPHRPGPGRRDRARAPGIAAASAAPRGAIWLCAVLIIGAGALVYSGTLSAPFLFDDENSIVSNTQIRQLSPLSVPLSPPNDTPVAGRPIVNLTFALNYAAHGLDVTGYRVTNVAIHVLAALVVFGLVRRTLLLPRLAQAFGDAATPIALVTSLIWLLHPLQTESVSYLSQRTESLMGLFFFLTLYCAVRGWTARAVIACALGMACKESMVVAPVIVLLYDRVLRFDTLDETLRSRGPLYAGLALTWLVLAGLMVGTPRTSVGFSAGVDWWTYLLNQAQLVPRYLFLVVWPRPLVLDYGLPQPLTLGDVWGPGLLVVVLVALTAVALWKAPLLGLAGAWFFLTLAPTSSIVPIATEVGAERRMYLPLAAFALLATVGLYCAASIFKDGGAPLSKRAWLPVGAVLCVFLAAGTYARGREYASRLTMAETIVERWPQGRGRFLLGTELLLAGQRERGMAELRLSARDFPGARFALGTELIAEQRLQEGVGELQAFITAIPEHPNVVPARDMLGRVYLGQGNFPAAADQFTRIQQVAPSYRGPNNDILRNLGYALAASGRITEAVPVLERAVTANPNDAAARELLARARTAVSR